MSTASLPGEEIPAAKNSNAPAILAETLWKDYLDRARGTVHAVQGVSFDCRYGEIVGLLGPNGAGKTTTLRILATVLKPTAGHGRIADFDIEKQSLQVRKHLGFLTGGTGLYGRLTPIEILRFFGRLHEMPQERIEENIARLVRLFQMDEYQNSHCDRLSTGQ
jgi:sodium transport system ATP-binding protein